MRIQKDGIYIKYIILLLIKVLYSSSLLAMPTKKVGATTQCQAFVENSFLDAKWKGHSLDEVVNSFEPAYPTGISPSNETYFPPIGTTLIHDIAATYFRDRGYLVFWNIVEGSILSGTSIYPNERRSMPRLINEPNDYQRIVWSADGQYVAITDNRGMWIISIHKSGLKNKGNQEQEQELFFSKQYVEILPKPSYISSANSSIHFNGLALSAQHQIAFVTSREKIFIVDFSGSSQPNKKKTSEVGVYEFDKATLEEWMEADGLYLDTKYIIDGVEVLPSSSLESSDELVNFKLRPGPFTISYTTKSAYFIPQPQSFFEQFFSNIQKEIKKWRRE